MGKPGWLYRKFYFPNDTPNPHLGSAVGEAGKDLLYYKLPWEKERERDRERERTGSH